MKINIKLILTCFTFSLLLQQSSLMAIETDIEAAKKALQPKLVNIVCLLNLLDALSTDATLKLYSKTEKEHVLYGVAQGASAFVNGREPNDIVDPMKKTGEAFDKSGKITTWITAQLKTLKTKTFDDLKA